MGLVFLGSAQWATGYLFATAKSLRRWGFAFCALSICVAAAGWTWDSSFRVFGEGEVGQRPTIALLAAAVFVGFAWFRKGVDWTRFGALILGLCVTLGPYYLPLEGLAERVLGFILVCAFLTAFTLAAARAGSRRGVNFGAMSLAARVVVLFFEIFQDLTRTGVGLIFTGILLLGVAFAAWKLRTWIPIAEPVSPPARGEP